MDGRPGVKGTPGEQGDVGITGLPGPKGDRGLDGPAGLPGIKGNKGDKGMGGFPGKDGEKGSTGNTGLQVNLVSLDKLGTREKEEFQDKWELKQMMGNLAFLEFLVNLGKASLEKRDCLDCLESREDLVCREYLESRAILVLMV